MAKIRTSLLVSYLVIIGLTLFLSVFLIIVYSNIESRYRAISDNMVLEYSITETFSQLVNSYTYLLQDIHNKELRSTYESSNLNLEEIFSKLDKTIVFPKSKDQYIRIKNMAAGIKKECDNGLSSLSEKNFTQGTGIYDMAIRGNDYIKENTATLILYELEYSKELQQKLQSLRSITLISSFVLIIFIVFGSVFFAIVYSNLLSSPLMKLSNIAESISKGDLSIEVSKDLLEKKDEIGSLSNSFHNMLKRLKTEIESQLEINSKLQESNQKLNEMDKKKDEFISISSHELKTPVTVIKGFSQLLKDKKISLNKKKRDYYLDLIDQNTTRLNNFIFELVDSSRLDLGKLTIKSEPVDVPFLSNEIKTEMEQLIKNKKLKSVFKIEKKLPKIIGDEERILQVVRNFITNAVKYTDKGSVFFNIYKSGDYIQFEVKDTGRGIPKDKQKFIFSKFYQVDSSFTREFGGSGLGLSICKGLVENMKGKIGFESVEGKGSTFYFAIPVLK
jgi:signal transduction histidine kinase